MTKHNICYIIVIYQDYERNMKRESRECLRKGDAWLREDTLEIGNMGEGLGLKELSGLEIAQEVWCEV